MEERNARQLRLPTFSLPENLKLNTGNFFHTLPLEGQSQGGARILGFPRAARFL